MESSHSQDGVPLHVQYQVAAARRQGFDTLMWQTPVVSLTGLAFLFLIALGSGTAPLARLIASFLAFLASLFSAQLLAKHRYYEKYWAEWLEVFEEDQHLLTIGAKVINPKNPLMRQSSYKMWLLLFVVFALAALATFLITLVQPTCFLPPQAG